ncbi:hypothetical protein [Parachlamydia sp. AcF125]|uniref:hypothetical protein n=1 Tax=Parachlamydia sp. AcF125 TaxID=2795736 RepID=UPI001BC92178|nr:hypothetical protein [Parachlamydia sp. AcF125]MBS4168300.1 hypothetical protein [Parachlamydia sp. AcF125]
MRINISFLVKADQVSDYIPGISTVTNLVDLFQKFVVLPSKQKANISKSHYYTYLQQKSFSRCLVLLIPVIGNIIIAVDDFAKNNPSHEDANLAVAQPAPVSAPQSSSNCRSPEPAEGLATDIGRHQSRNSKSVVVGKREVRASNAVQQDYSQAILMAGYSEATVRQIAAEVLRKSPK